jgi:predicted ATPase
VSSSAYVEIEMRQHGLLRPLKAAKLSDATLRFPFARRRHALAVAAGVDDSQRAETSLHPDLLRPLGRLIVPASKRSQMIVVLHASTLVAALDQYPNGRQIVLEKELSETVIRDYTPPDWTWPSR